MKTRIISGVCMIPLLAIVYLGGPYLIALCLAIGLMGIKEFYAGFKHMDIYPNFVMGYIFIIGFYIINGISSEHQYKYLMPWLVLAAFCSFIYMFNIGKRKIADSLATFIGIFYVGFFSFHVVLIDGMPKFSNFVWLVLITAFASDVFAYFTGVFMGKHKLAPKLSPKKTVEGAIGGLIGSGVCSMIFVCIVMPSMILHGFIIGILGSAFSMCGDLTASAYKREMGIKDYGNLIPGHGGIMDRFDSVLFTAPFIYYYIVLIIS